MKSLVLAAIMITLPTVHAAAPCVTLTRAQAAKLAKAAGLWKGIFVWTEKSGQPIPAPGAWPKEGAVKLEQGKAGAATLVVEGTPRDLAEVWIVGLDDFASMNNAAAYVGCKVVGVPKRIDEKTQGPAGDLFRKLVAEAEAAPPTAPEAAGPAEIIRTMSISSRGVAFDADVDGKVSELLSSASTGSMAIGFPIDKMGLPAGAHSLGITVRKVADGDTFVRITLQENAPGEMVDTSAEGVVSPPFPIALGGAQLQPGAKHAFTFTTTAR